MTRRRLINRRMAISDLGRAGLAIMVFGTAACAGDDGIADSSRPSTSIPPSTSNPDDSSTSTSSTGPSPTFTDTTSFHRVDLGFVSAYILYRGGEAAIVDTGVADSEADIEAALAEVDLGWGSVGHLILTHKHPDHQGSADAVLEAAPQATLYAGVNEIPRIQTSVAPTPVAEGDHVFGLEVIDTPGHTAGHIAILDRESGILVSGDAMNGKGSGVAGSGLGIGGANPQFSEDMTLANASIKKLATFDYRAVLFGHGEPILDGGSQAVRDWVSQLP